MKKILFAFMAMYCFMACDPSDSFPDNEGEWWVKNDTNEAIGIWCDWTFMEPKIEKVMPEIRFGCIVMIVSSIESRYSMIYWRVNRMATKRFASPHRMAVF